jgi:hypothetical protein
LKQNKGVCFNPQIIQTSQSVNTTNTGRTTLQPPPPQICHNELETTHNLCFRFQKCQSSLVIIFETCTLLQSLLVVVQGERESAAVERVGGSSSAKE